MELSRLKVEEQKWRTEKSKYEAANEKLKFQVALFKNPEHAIRFNGYQVNG